MSGTYYLDFSDKIKVITDFYKVSIYNQFYNILEDGSKEMCVSIFEDITDEIDKMEVTQAHYKKSPEDTSDKLCYMIVGYKNGVRYDLIPDGKIARKIAFDRVWCDGEVRLLYRIYIVDV